MDLNVMMREHALSGLQVQLDAAVTNGDTAAARKISDDIAKLTVQTAPKAPPYGDVEVRAELDKQPWFGVDPKKSTKAVEYGKMMDPRKFATAAAFVEAVVKAVEADFPVAKPAGGEVDPPEEEEGNEGGKGDPEEGEKKPQRRATDSPGAAEALGVRPRSGVKSGPWTKLSDAPQNVQTDIKRAMDKHLPSTATKEQREMYTTRALEGHYNAHQRAKGKK